jgi:predicted Na+-dependent transporter
MSAKQPKLMTKGKFALCLAAVIVGASLQPVREYRATGAVSTQTGVIAAITFCIGLAIVLAVGWWANRPERGGSNE